MVELDALDRGVLDHPSLVAAVEAGQFELQRDGSRCSEHAGVGLEDDVVMVG